MNNKQLPKHGKNSNRNFFAFLALVLVIGAAGIAYVQHLDDANRKKLESKASSKKKSTSSSHQNLFVKKKSSSTSKIKSSSTTEKSVMRTPIDWQKSSETVDYPDLNKVENLWIEVRLRSNRTLLKDGDKTIYTMYSSGGEYHNVDGKQVSYTPTGTYYIENERGESFFNNSLNEGARYYISGSTMASIFSTPSRRTPRESMTSKSAKSLANSPHPTAASGFPFPMRSGFTIICQSARKSSSTTNNHRRLEKVPVIA